MRGVRVWKSKNLCDWQAQRNSQNSLKEMVLNEDEKKLLAKEGVNLPNKLPLSKVLYIRSHTGTDRPKWGLIRVSPEWLSHLLAVLSYVSAGLVWGESPEENSQEDSKQAVSPGEQEEEEGICWQTGGEVGTPYELHRTQMSAQHSV